MANVSTMVGTTSTRLRSSSSKHVSWATRNGHHISSSIEDSTSKLIQMRRALLSSKQVAVTAFASRRLSNRVRVVRTAIVKGKEWEGMMSICQESKGSHYVARSTRVQKVLST